MATTACAGGEPSGCSPSESPVSELSCGWLQFRQTDDNIVWAAYKQGATPTPRPTGTIKIFLPFQAREFKLAGAMVLDKPYPSPLMNFTLLAVMVPSRCFKLRLGKLCFYLIESQHLADIFWPLIRSSELSANCRHFEKIIQHVYIMTDPVSVSIVKDSWKFLLPNPGHMLGLIQKYQWKLRNLHEQTCHVLVLGNGKKTDPIAGLYSYTVLKSSVVND